MERGSLRRHERISGPFSSREVKLTPMNMQCETDADERNHSFGKTKGKRQRKTT